MNGRFVEIDRVAPQPQSPNITNKNTSKALKRSRQCRWLAFNMFTEHLTQWVTCYWTTEQYLSPKMGDKLRSGVAVRPHRRACVFQSILGMLSLISNHDSTIAKTSWHFIFFLISAVTHFVLAFPPILRHPNFSAEYSMMFDRKFTNYNEYSGQMVHGKRNIVITLVNTIWDNQ